MTMRTPPAADALCRPQRLGVFGRRGAGKTTLLTMLYREAVSGRLPGLRLAAADARTADYLADKVRQLEAGQPLPATLGETELRFNLYRGRNRVELLVKDYQGEHVAVGRAEPIRDFLRDCDAVWLCLEAGLIDGPTLPAEQEVEQVVEDYLAREPNAAGHRPMALVLTKSDLLPANNDPASGGSHAPGDEYRGDHSPRSPETPFTLTNHALTSHCPSRGAFAVSSLGHSLSAGVPFEPRPAGLDAPLGWLLDTLRAQDEARLESLFAGPCPRHVLTRCVAAFARRWPDAPLAADFRRRLAERHRLQTRRRVLFTAAAALFLFLSLWTYDVWGEHRAEAFAAEHGDDPAAVREGWLTYRAWHPTRHLFHPAAANSEDQRLRDLDAAVRARERNDQLADVRRRAADPDADPEQVWHRFQEFRTAFPEQDVDDDLNQFRAALKSRRDGERERKAQAAYAEMLRAGQDEGPDRQADRAGRFLAEFAGTSLEEEARARRAACLLRLEERDVEEARAYSRRNPLNFYVRREHYQRYLDRHPGGTFAKEATDALATIESDWDKHDFRGVRDHFQQKPGDVQSLQALARSYLAIHPQGRFRDAAHDLLRWTERVTAPGEYRVVLKSGDFDHSVAPFFSRGAKLSVMIEVAGVRHGPSSIVKNRYDPDWDYEFPRRVRWKLGDPVRIVVTDNNYWGKVVADVSFDGDPLALRMLTGDVQTPKGRLTFGSDFALPQLPVIE
jgi:hypothetical protein